MTAPRAKQVENRRAELTALWSTACRAFEAQRRKTWDNLPPSARDLERREKIASATLPGERHLCGRQIPEKPVLSGPGDARPPKVAAAAYRRPRKGWGCG